MATLVIDKARSFELGDIGAVPVISGDVIYEGAAVGHAAGFARPLVAADSFLGFAETQADNTDGAAGAVNVRVREVGKVQMPVVGVTGVANVGASVYASDDDTFTLTATGNSLIGKITQYVSGTTVIVSYKSSSLS